MVQKLSFSFLQYIGLCGEASKIYKLILIEHTCTVGHYMHNGLQYLFRLLEKYHNCAKGETLFHIYNFNMCTFIISDLRLCR